MECRTVERLGRLEKHWEHVGSECKYVGLEYEHVGSASTMELVGSESEVEYQDSENE